MDDTREINNEIVEHILHHEKECNEKNMLRYMSRAFFTWSAVATIIGLIAVIATYYKAEASQNERCTVLEQRADQMEQINRDQFGTIIKKIDNLTNTIGVHE